ncbi:MAG: DUF4342 domain-containing protein [Anaerolineae bacterium]|nr:DUF4342 domain-containing protein [Anaerolineae bacterium]
MTEPTAATAESSLTDTFHVSSDQLLTTLKDLVHEGNVRRVLIADTTGKTLLEVPLSVGLLSALVAPAWVAVGVIATLAAHYTIVVERTPDAASPSDDS